MASCISFSSPSLLANKHGMHKPHPPFSCKLVMSRTVTTGRKSLATSMVALTPATAPEAKTSLARIWREIQGCDDWENLMKPLNPLLRQEIVRYGEFVIACYKALDLDPKSKRYLNCKFGKRSMLRDVGMAACGYEVTKYIYSTPDIGIPTQSGKCCSPWVGYVAVSSDNEALRLGRRDILVSFRGTVTNAEWIANFMSSLIPARLDPNNPRPDVKVELGFLSLYTSHDSTFKFSPRSCREQVLSELSRIINEFKGEEVSITLAGHSMGSALALLLAYDLAELGLNGDGLNRKVPITVYSFGGPRVGNLDFKMRCEELGVKVLRVVNVNDPVTKLPGIFLNENSRILAGRFEFPWSCSCYAHVGVELALDFFQIENPTCVHDLDTYIGLLKCPKVKQVRRKGVDFLRKARNLFTKQTLDVWPWQDAAIQVGNLVQALGI